MKIKNLLAGMAACVALAACTNEDLVETGNGNEGNNTVSKAYIGIKIADPTNGIARAADGGYDNGSAEEHAIKNSLFLFYKDGTFISKGTFTGSLTPGATSPNGTAIEANTTAVVVLHGTQGEMVYPNQVVAFLNLPTELENKLNNQPLTEALKIVEKTAIPDFANNFIMTNSVYYTGTDTKTVQIATPVNVNNFAQSEEAAKANPIDIYVERIAAKVKMQEGDIKNDGNKPNINVNFNGKSGYQLKLTIDGWGINGLNKSSYLLKKINPDNWNFSNWNWNTSTDKRSFWAEDGNYADGVYPGNFEEYNTSTSSLEYRSWNDINTNRSAEYCLENTMDAATAANINATTYMIITGHYDLIDQNKNVVELKDKKIYKYIDQLYLEADLIANLASTANLYTLDSKEGQDKWTKVTDKQYKIGRASLYDGKLEVADETISYYASKDKATQMTAAQANELLASKLGTFTAFNGGKTFFYINIEHLNPAEKEDGHIGIVRNHTYELTLNSIKNLGNGVFDPDEDIIITPKDKEFYVAATLKILAWKVVKQDVNL